MPKLNGIEATNTLRQMDDQLKIIALTGYSKDEVKQKFGVAPFDGYLNKPLEVDKLLPLLGKLYSDYT